MFMLAPSILSADFSQLAQQVGEIEKGGADLIHVDVMDGHFVPNISYGAVVMKSLNGKTKLPYDVHLMIEDPDRYLEDFVTENTRFITVHMEACRHINRTLQHIRDTGVGAAAAINPGTPVSALDCVLADVDMVLLMSVNPGFGGQKFIPQVLDKARQLKKLREERGLDFLIEIDGGVTLGNVRDVTDAGVDVAVAGSAVFGAEDIAKRTGEFKALYR